MQSGGLIGLLTCPPAEIVEPRSRLRIARMRAGPGAGSIYNTIGSSTKFSFDVDDESRLLLTPGTSRFSAGPGTHIVTVAIGTSIGQATRTITVQLDRLYQIYDTDGDVLPDDLYQITLAIPFADEISANRDVAEFRPERHERPPCTAPVQPPKTPTPPPPKTTLNLSL